MHSLAFFVCVDDVAKCDNCCDRAGSKKITLRENQTLVSNLMQR
jgi:hypothetical protein